MKLTSKQRRFSAAILHVLVVAGCSARGATSNSRVDIWIGNGVRSSHVHAAPSAVVCGRGGAQGAGWESRIEGGAGDAVRRIDVVIPRAAASGTTRFYIGLTIADARSLEQIAIETRTNAARQSGQGRAWVEATDSSVRMTIVARTTDSAWYVVDLRCDFASPSKQARRSSAGEGKLSAVLLALPRTLPHH